MQIHHISPAFFQKDIGFTKVLLTSNLYLFALQTSTNFLISSSLISIPLWPKSVNLSFLTVKVFPAFYALGLSI